MSNRIYILLSAFLLTLQYGYSQNQPDYNDLTSDIIYKIQPKYTNDDIQITIDCVFKSNSTPMTFTGFFPQANMQQHTYLVQEIVSDSVNVSISKTSIPLLWQIKHKPESIIHLRYTLIQDSAAFASQNIFKPFPVIIGRSYFLLENASLFLIPAEWLSTDESYRTNRKIKIQWKTDSTWKYSNSFGFNQSQQTLHVSTKDFMRNMTLASRNPQRCVISSLQISKQQDIHVATLGKFSSINELFAKSIRQAAKSCLHFFQDTTSFSFLTAILPVELSPEDENGGLGFALNNAFLGMISEKKDSLNYTHKYIFNHELIHKWVNAERFFTQDFTGFGYCAAEGFTDYLARYVMLQSGIITRAEYVQDINTQVRNYLQSPVRNIIADSIKKNYWSNLPIMKVPYRRGDILAHIWSNEIRKHTQGKHDFATALRDILRQHSGSVIIDQTFAKALEPYIGRNVIDDILKYMKNGETIPIPSDMIPFARLSAKQDSTGIPQFELISETK